MKLDYFRKTIKQSKALGKRISTQFRTKVKTRRLGEGIGFLIATAFLLTAGANIWVILATKARVFQDEQNISPKDVGLVLGTSKKLIGGDENPFFAGRIESAAQLYHSGKIKHFILSGDNNTKYYNEPLDMKLALVAKGVPEARITLDYAGFRTLDSVIRCKEIFGQQSITIITQKVPQLSGVVYF